MNGKSGASIGIEYDARCIRAVRLSGLSKGKEGRCVVEALEEVRGDYSREEGLLAGLTTMAGKIRPKTSDRVIACVAGKQVLVTQVKLKELPQSADMKKALRAEIRKKLTLESAVSELDYQIMEERDPARKSAPLVTVTAVSKPVVERQVELLEKAGFQPDILDVLPAAVANAFWIGRQDPYPNKAHVLIHCAAELCTVVIDGAAAPFYTRSVFFPAEECFGEPGGGMPGREKTQQLDTLADELRRSLAYYNNNLGAFEFGLFCATGGYAQNAELGPFLRDKLDLEADDSPLLGRINSKKEAAAGRFDVALACALRGSEN